jgi:hypothetical protein
MKSAYELAMERLQQKEGAHAPLSAEQKRELADIESQIKARVAEIEIMRDRELADARAKGDAEAVAKLSAQRVDDLRRARERGEAEKEEVRRRRS